MKLARAGWWVLGATLLAAGCKTDDNRATPWEIIHGTATLTASAEVVPDTRAPLVSHPTRTGHLTVADDSTVTGVIHLGASDSAVVTGTVVEVGGDWVMTLNGLTPSEYTLITDGSFATTYGLLSTAILTANITGDPATEQYRVYWQFER
jgi:hypothetical protein